MAAVLRIKLADLLAVMVSDLSPRAGVPAQQGFAQLTLTGQKSRDQTDKPEIRPMSTKLDDKELWAIQRYLRSGPATRKDLEFALSMSGSAILHRLKFLRQKGTVVLLTDNTYALPETLQ